jgi:hypothetical protein
MDDLLFICHLIAYHRTLNRLVGIEFDTDFISGLLDYADHLQQQADERRRQAAIQFQAAYLSGFIRTVTERVKAIIADADTEEKAEVVLPAVMRLYEQIERSTTELERLEAQ